MTTGYPILEFDDSSEAILEPCKIYERLDTMPERCVLPIYHEVIEGLQEKNLVTRVTDIGTPMGAMPVYRMTHAGEDVAVAEPGLGAPFAAAVLEELIALGCRKFIACGTAGVLDSDLRKGTIVVPNAAVRDEGTSYHYLPPSREIAAQPDTVRAIQSVLDADGAEYRVGKTWTTDAVYRETKNRIAKRKSEGCLTVEMECAAFLAVAAFRGVRFGQLLGVTDDVSGDDWNYRGTEKGKSSPEQLFWLSVESCLRL